MSIRASQLHGLDYRTAELMGKPHIGAFFARDDAKSNRLCEDARCVVCGRGAANSHHVVPLSKLRSWDLKTPLGIFVLKSPLFAVCGSGTTGCHDGFHGGARYRAAWVWDTEKDMDDWWSGWTLAHGFTCNDERLFRQGRYVISDLMAGTEWEVRR